MSFVLAMLGETKTESMSKGAAQNRLEALGYGRKDTEKMSSVAAESSYEALPKDARELRAWLERAAVVLPQRSV